MQFHHVAFQVSDFNVRTERNLTLGPLSQWTSPMKIPNDHAKLHISARFVGGRGRKENNSRRHFYYIRSIGKGINEARVNAGV